MYEFDPIHSFCFFIPIISLLTSSCVSGAKLSNLCTSVLINHNKP